MHGFDTHESIKYLVNAGIKENQAESIVQLLYRSRDYDFANLATKDQVNLLKEQINALEKRMDSFATKDELKAEIASIKYDLLKWIIPFLIGIIIAIIAK